MTVYEVFRAVPQRDPSRAGNGTRNLASPPPKGFSFEAEPVLANEDATAHDTFQENGTQGRRNPPGDRGA